ncbi:hypothetical protein EMPS_10347 [Entomortierella parvispora]|uniref:Uncharacterized protein n=1 Tax=Entomortierella parvispora TaxID=205924 RepID=A0A9P3HKC8_9FUNG|nr:hypothetical protein EMPS_10347 [Entomortierella parvispora]
MLRPAHLSHSRNHSFENNTPCPPPYNQSADDTYTGQNSTSGRRVVKEQVQDFEDDLLSQVDQIHDPVLLKRLLIQKEQERIGLASNLDLAARLGLDLHQQMQQMEQDSYTKFQSLQDENLALQVKASQSQELSYQLAGSENEVKELTGHNRFLQRELDSCRHELKSFRRELDELSEQMAEMGAEMVEAKTKVNSYARRLGEVEQELAATQELNVNLQLQLENALQKQKQTHSTTTQAVKLIQSDLGKVFSDSDTMRLTLEELESRQMNCEGKVLEMMTNTREYAQLLEEAQETITSMRIESDLEGRNWASVRGPQAVIWDQKTGTPPLPPQHFKERSSPSGVSGSGSAGNNMDDLEGHPEHTLQQELDPMFDNGDWDQNSGVVNSLGSELGFSHMGATLSEELEGYSRRLDQELGGFHGGLDHELNDFPRGLDQELRDSEEPKTLDLEIKSTELHSEAVAPSRQHHVTFDDTASPVDPKPEQNPYHRQQFAERPVEPTPVEYTSDPLAELIRRTGSNPSTPTPPQQRLSLSAELHQRLEENNILQTVLSGAPRSTWNANAAAAVLTSVLMSPTQQRSPNALRDVGMGLSLVSMAARTSNHMGHGSASSTPLPSPLTKTHLDNTQTQSSSSDSTLSHQIGHDTSTASTAAGSGPNATPSATSSRPPGRSGVSAETQNSLGLKYLLSATSSADLSNVVTKAKAAKGTKARSNSVGRAYQPNFPSGKGKSNPSSGSAGNQDSDRIGRPRTSSVSSTTSSTSSNSTARGGSYSNSGRTTPTKPIAVPKGKSTPSNGRKSPAASWSAASSLTSYMMNHSTTGRSASSTTGTTTVTGSGVGMTSSETSQRRPSLPPLPLPSSFTSSSSSSHGSSKPRPQWT